MPKATQPTGKLQTIDKCYVEIPTSSISGSLPGIPISISLNSNVRIPINNLPEISDSKQAVYNNDPIIGRASPLHTYHYSDTRNISIQFHFIVTEQSDLENNLKYLRAIESAVYPREGDSNIPFRPPPICKLRCGNLLAVDKDLCVVLQQYSVKFPTDVVWDKDTLCPYKFDVDTTWLVVYSSQDLPTNSRIYSSGR
jgi:hypothetical protein